MPYPKFPHPILLSRYPGFRWRPTHTPFPLISNPESLRKIAFPRFPLFAALPPFLTRLEFAATDGHGNFDSPHPLSRLGFDACPSPFFLFPLSWRFIHPHSYHSSHRLVPISLPHPRVLPVSHHVGSCWGFLLPTGPHHPCHFPLV